MRKLCLMLLFLMTACDDPGGPDLRVAYDWQFFGLAEHRVTAIEATPVGLFAGTRFGGVHRHTGGSNWEPSGLTHAAIGDLLYHDATGLLLAGMTPRAEETTEAAVFASADSGRTWIPRDDGLSARAGFREWAFSLGGAGDTLFLGTSFDIARSVDGGVSWQYVWGSGDGWGAGVEAITVSPWDSRTVYAAAGSGDFRAFLFRSDDGGETWTVPFISPPPNSDAAATDVAVDLFVPARVWIASQALLRSDAAGENVHVLDVAATKLVLTPDRYLAFSGFLGEDFVTRLRVKESLDRGETWTPVFSPREAGWLLSVESVGDSVFVGTDRGIWLMTPAE